MAATAGMLLVPPMVRREASAAMPIGLAKERKWVVRVPWSLHTTMALPAWEVDDEADLELVEEGGQIRGLALHAGREGRSVRGQAQRVRTDAREDG